MIIVALALPDVWPREKIKGGKSITQKPLTGEELNELVAGLNKLSRNLWWSWDQEAQELFQELSPRAWQNLYHNAVAVLREVSEYELRVHLQDADFARPSAPCCTTLKLILPTENLVTS